MDIPLEATDSNLGIVMLEEEVTTDPVNEVIIDISGQEEVQAGESIDSLENIVKVEEENDQQDQDDTRKVDGEENDVNEEVYEVESVQQERSKKGIKEYLVRWKGYGSEYDTWEPEDNLNCDDIIEHFNRQKRKRGRNVAAKQEEEDEDLKGQPPNSLRKNRAKRAQPKRQVPKRKPPATQKVTKCEPKKRRKSKKEPPLVIRCKTIFKKHLIKNCIKCEDRRHPDDEHSADAIVKYFMRYDLESGNFFVGDVRVEVDEVKKCIKCSTCEKVFGDLTLEQKVIPGKAPLSLWQMVRDMKLHIVGRHLGGFTCPLCDEPYVFHTRSATHYYRHTSQFHREDRQNTDEMNPPVEADEEVADIEYTN